MEAYCIVNTRNDFNKQRYIQMEIKFALLYMGSASDFCNPEGETNS